MKTYSLILVLMILTAAFAATDAGAQTARKKTTKRTNTIARQQARQPVRTIEPEIVSTADDLLQSETEDRTSQNDEDEAIVIDPKTGKPVKPKGKGESLSDTQAERGNTAELTRQITELTNKIKSLEAQQRGLIDLEKLSRAEERANALRRQLTETAEKESQLNLKLEQLEEQSRPENIQRDAAVIGSLRPEEVRESRRRIIENEKQRIREQITQIQTNKARLETALVNADALAEKLRARVEAADDENTKEAEATDEKAETPEANRADEEDKIPDLQ